MSSAEGALLWGKRCHGVRTTIRLSPRIVHKRDVDQCERSHSRASMKEALRDRQHGLEVLHALPWEGA